MTAKMFEVLLTAIQRPESAVVIVSLAALGVAALALYSVVLAIRRIR